MFQKRLKTTVNEFSETLAFFIIKEVQSVISKDESIRSLGLEPQNLSNFYMDLMIIHTFATCESFNYIELEGNKRNQILDAFHQTIISKIADDEVEFKKLYQYLIKRYELYNSIHKTGDSQYLINLGGVFFRSLSNAEPDAISVLNINKLYINAIGVVRDAYPKYKIKF